LILVKDDLLQLWGEKKLRATVDLLEAGVSLSRALTRRTGAIGRSNITWRLRAGDRSVPQHRAASLPVAAGVPSRGNHTFLGFGTYGMPGKRPRAMTNVHWLSPRSKLNAVSAVIGATLGAIWLCLGTGYDSFTIGDMRVEEQPLLPCPREDME